MRGRGDARDGWAVAPVLGQHRARPSKVCGKVGVSGVDPKNRVRAPTTPWTQANAEATVATGTACLVSDRELKP